MQFSYVATSSAARCASPNLAICCWRFNNSTCLRWCSRSIRRDAACSERIVPRQPVMRLPRQCTNARHWEATEPTHALKFPWGNWCQKRVYGRKAAWLSTNHSAIDGE